MGGTVSENEWTILMQDSDLCYEMCKLADITENDLQDTFQCFASQPETYKRLKTRQKKQHGDKLDPCDKYGESNGRILNYIDFVDSLRSKDYGSDRRSVLHLMDRLECMEERLTKRIDSATNGYDDETEQKQRCMSRPA